jgi:hypothetical protein
MGDRGFESSPSGGETVANLTSSTRPWPEATNRRPLRYWPLTTRRRRSNHVVLFWAACRVGEVIAAGQIDSELGMELLAGAAEIAGLPEVEARRTIADGFARTR